MFKTVKYEKRDSIAYATLNRPEALNAYSIQMRDDLYEVFCIVRDDPDVLAMIISGAGRGFCAGADLTEFGTAPSPAVARSVRWGRDLWGVLRDTEKLTIAAMHGYALGSGLEMALLCDLRLAAKGTRFGLPETALGFIPAAGATQALPRVVRPGIALGMILTGERIDVETAYRAGLVHRILAPDSLLVEAESLAKLIVRAGRGVIALAKEAVNKGLDMPLEEGLRLEERLNGFAYSTKDVWEAMRAYTGNDSGHSS